MSGRLLVIDPHGERELMVVGPVVVGRDPQCEISNADRELSRRHAEFTPCPQGVVVRDLGSRNGILVNGVPVSDATLTGGDVVQIASLRITFVEDSPAQAAAPASAQDEDADEKTILFDAASIAAHPAGRSALHELPNDDQPPDDEKTRLLAPSSAVEFAAPASTVAPRPMPAARPAVETRQAGSGERPAHAVAGREPAPAPTAAPQPRVARLSWGGRVLVTVLGMALVVFLATAGLLNLWQSRIIHATALARAMALVSWLAADAAVGLQAGDPGRVTDALAREPGVVTALVMAADGRVIAPASRATELFDEIPGLAVKPDEVLRDRYAWHDGLIEIARPVRTPGHPRAAIAWITFRPGVPPDVGSSIIVLGPLVIAVLIVGMLAAESLRRTTLRAVTSFNEDVELALSGQIPEVADTLSARPMKELAETVNYLIARLRAAGPAAPAEHRARPVRDGYAHQAKTLQRVPSERGARTTAAPPAQSSEPNGDAGRKARIVVSADFRITEVSPECADLLGVRPAALEGRHLVDAITDQPVVDAILSCLTALEAEVQQRVTVGPPARASAMTLDISRAGREQPAVIVLSAGESTAKP